VAFFEIDPMTTNDDLARVICAWQDLSESARDSVLAEVSTTPRAHHAPRHSVRDIAGAYMTHADQTFRRPDGTPTRNAANVALVLRDLLDQFAQVGADEFRAAELKQLRRFWVNRGLCRTTINQRVGVVMRAWTWAAEMGLVFDDSASRLRSVRNLKRGSTIEGKGVQAVPLTTILATIRHMSEDLAAPVRFMLLTGCRVGEAREARSDEIDTRGPWVLRPQWHKCAKHGLKREIPLNKPARILVNPRMNRTFIFGPGRGDRPYHRDSILVAIYRACDRAGIDHWSPGQIRHTTAMMVLGKHGLEAARALLGHTTDRVTRRYTGQGEGPQLQQAIEVLADAL
jgi:integrase